MTPLLISVAGEPVSLWPDRALGWRDALFVADVHIGKSAVFRKAGLPMPPGELEHDLSRLSALVACSGARRLVVLGDFVHGMVGDGVTQAVSEWRKNLTTTWFVVRGNHDRHVPGSASGSTAPHFRGETPYSVPSAVRRRPGSVESTGSQRCAA